MRTLGTRAAALAVTALAATLLAGAPAHASTHVRELRSWGAIGDSISAGSGATAPANSYASRAGIPAIGKPGQALATSSYMWPALTLTFPAEVAELKAQGVNAVVVEIGVNDLNDALSDATLKTAYRTLEAEGRAAGVSVVLSTITPDIATTTFPQRQQRWRINQWIRHRGPHVDYARAVGGWNWSSPGLTADGVHPSDAGHALMAAALERFIAPRNVHAF